MIRDNYLDISRITTDPNVLKIFKIVSRHGGAVRFVGGAVRDALAGCSASNLDLSTDLSPDELAEACEDAGVRNRSGRFENRYPGVLINGTLLEISSLKNRSKPAAAISKWNLPTTGRPTPLSVTSPSTRSMPTKKRQCFDYYNGIEDLEKESSVLSAIPTGRFAKTMCAFCDFSVLFPVRQSADRP